MDLFDMMRRLDSLRPDTENIAEGWAAWLERLQREDRESLKAVFDKMDAFGKEELGFVTPWEAVSRIPLDRMVDMPEPFLRAWEALIAYSMALYKAAIARDALLSSVEGLEGSQSQDPSEPG